MAIADTITSMQNHTSNAYNTLAYATDLTGVNKNLANLKQCIFDSLINTMSDTLNPTWNNLPKITTTAGTSQSINNTIEAPMRVQLNASELSQSGTPTPSSPQDIHSISGNNTINVCGKNIISNIDIYAGYPYASDGQTLTYYASVKTNTYKKCCYVYAGETYTLSWKINTPNTIGPRDIKICNENEVQLENIQYSNAGNNRTVSFTPTHSGWVYASLDANATELQIEVGSATTYQAYNGKDYEVNLSNNNLFDKNNANILNASFSNANITSSSNAKTLYVPITGGKSYIINKIQSERFRVGTTQNIPAINGTIIDYIENTTATSILILTSKNANYLVVYYFLNGTDTLTEQTILNSISIYDLSTYNSLLPIEYGSISTYEDKFIRNSGKNLFDISKLIVPRTSRGIKITSNDNITLTLDGLCNQNNLYFTADDNNKILLKAGTYIFSSNSSMSIQLQCKKAISGTTFNINKGTAVTLDEDSYIFNGMFFTTNGTNYNETIWLQLEQNNSATSFEPYGSNQWYIKKNIGKVVLDGSENWATGGNGTFFRYDNDTFPLTSSGSATVSLSNYYSAYDYNSIYNGSPDYAFGFAQNVHRLALRNKDCADTTALTAWLSTHNTIVYYPLATPTYTLITGTLAEQLENIYNAYSKDGMTNLSQINNDLPFILDTGVLENIGG